MRLVTVILICIAAAAAVAGLVAWAADGSEPRPVDPIALPSTTPMPGTASTRMRHDDKQPSRTTPDPVRTAGGAATAPERGGFAPRIDDEDEDRDVDDDPFDDAHGDDDDGDEEDGD